MATSAVPRKRTAGPSFANTSGQLYDPAMVLKAVVCILTSLFTGTVAMPPRVGRGLETDSAGSWSADKPRVFRPIKFR